MISLLSLQAAGIAATQAAQFLKPLLETCDLYEINTPERQAAFVAQCAHESGNFVHLEESLYYRDPERIMKIWPHRVPTLLLASALAGSPSALANTVYAQRNGNGNVASGDGYKYRGRGLLQLTGRANYTAAALEVNEPYIDHPELVSEPPDACLTAGWYWGRTRCNQMADSADIDGITRAINGPGMVGAKERRDLFAKALKAFR